MPRVDTPALETARLLLKPIERDDAAEMAAVLSDPALYQFTGGGPPAPAALAVQYDRWAAGSPRAGETWHNWVIRVRAGRVAAGHLQATVIDANSTTGSLADIAWVVGTRWQGHGYATEAAVAVVAWLDAAGVDVITAHVHPDNLASARVARGAGLAATSKLEDGEVVWRRERHTAGDA